MAGQLGPTGHLAELMRSDMTGTVRLFR